MDRIRNFLALVRGQLWIMPMVIGGAAIALAYATLVSGISLTQPGDGDLWWLYSGDAASARDLLSALLSGLITMTSLVVSVTFVILTLASSQLGPRLVRNFIADRQIQAVLGLFVGTILYVLIVLRSLTETLGTEGVPHVAVTAASALTILCLGALLFYVHKIARSIIADTVVERVAHDLHVNIRDMLTDAQTAAEGVPPRAAPSHPVSLGRSGYIQTIDYATLVDVARRCDALLRLDVRAGHFVLSQGRHVEVEAARAPGEEIADAIRSAFVIGSERSPAQDLEYSIRQLVEIALRALSPGINDPFTAIAVIDRLGAALEEIMSHALQPAVLRDESGAMRVVADRSDLDGLASAAFDQIRQAARDHPGVLIHMADTLGRLAPVLGSMEARRVALEHLARLAETARLATLTPHDRDALAARIDQARTRIEAEGGR